MKQLIAALFAAAVCVAPAYAQQKSEMTEQQKRMQQCNADAKNKQFKGNDERQAFMSSCLKGEPQKELTEQQKRMQQCNADAKNKQFKSNDERQAFMSKCLSG
jgi:maltooligosyltrehalose synthase